MSLMACKQPHPCGCTPSGNGWVHPDEIAATIARLTKERDGLAERLKKAREDNIDEMKKAVRAERERDVLKAVVAAADAMRADWGIIKSSLLSVQALNFLAYDAARAVIKDRS